MVEILLENDSFFVFKMKYPHIFGSCILHRLKSQCLSFSFNNFEFYLLLLGWSSLSLVPVLLNLVNQMDHPPTSAFSLHCNRQTFLHISGKDRSPKCTDNQCRTSPNYNNKLNGKSFTVYIINFFWAAQWNSKLVSLLFEVTHTNQKGVCITMKSEYCAIAIKHLLIQNYSHRVYYQKHFRFNQWYP